MAIRFFDMFAGIGGFRSGLEAVGGFECVGHCEIDKYANQAYNAMYDTEGEVFFADARTIDPAALPDIDLICGGFPCQSFSIAGKRRGFADDARGTLFFEIARLAAAKRPAFLLLENVPGLLSHDNCRTFATILSTLDELGYDVAWQVLNSKDFGVPQSRKRVYIVGYLRGKCSGEILSFTDANGASLEQVLPGPEGCRVYSPCGVSITLTSNAGGFGGRSGLYDVTLPIIDLAYATMNTRRGRVGDKIAHTVTPGNNQGYFFIDLNEKPSLTENARCLLANQDAGIGKFKGGKSGVFVEGQAPFSIPVQDADGNLHYGKVRKLMPIECWRLQGFSDEQFNKAAATRLSDAQLYKMAGNAVTVPVISALGEKIKEIYWRSYRA